MCAHFHDDGTQRVAQNGLEVGHHRLEAAALLFALVFGVGIRIRVGALAPGLVDTPMTRGMQQRARAALMEAIPLGRIGAPHDIWLGVKFIIENDYFTGRCIDIDGGLNML